MLEAVSGSASASEAAMGSQSNFGVPFSAAGIEPFCSCLLRSDGSQAYAGSLAASQVTYPTHSLVRISVQRVLHCLFTLWCDVVGWSRCARQMMRRSMSEQFLAWLIRSVRPLQAPQRATSPLRPARWRATNAMSVQHKPPCDFPFPRAQIVQPVLFSYLLRPAISVASGFVVHRGEKHVLHRPSGDSCGALTARVRHRTWDSML